MFTTLLIASAIASANPAPPDARIANAIAQANKCPCDCQCNLGNCTCNRTAAVNDYGSVMTACAADNTPAVVWIGTDCSTCRARLRNVRHARVDSLPGFPPVGCVVAFPVNGQMQYTPQSVIAGQPSVEQIQAIMNGCATGVSAMDGGCATCGNSGFFRRRR